MLQLPPGRAASVVSRFEVQGKPSELHPKSVAKALGLRTDGPTSWASLLDAAVTAYWERRPEPECGTYPGYLMHLRTTTAPCDGCRKARAQVAAIQRRRRAA